MVRGGRVIASLARRRDIVPVAPMIVDALASNGVWQRRVVCQVYVCLGMDSAPLIMRYMSKIHEAHRARRVSNMADLPDLRFAMRQCRK